LNGCLNDAKYWTKTTKAMGFDSTQTLLEKKCTRTNMTRAIAATVKQALPGDLVVICYSGHGTILPPGVQSWVPIDMDWTDPETWLTYDDLDRILLHSEQNKVLVVVISDSCQSKADPRRHFKKLREHQSTPRFLEPPQEIQKRIVSDPFHRNILTADQDDLLLAAALKNQSADDDKIDGEFHGAFTYALSQVLEEDPKATYLKAVIKARAWLAENDYDQVPSANGAPERLNLRFFAPLPK
jgi:hypothetical protein